MSVTETRAGTTPDDGLLDAVLAMGAGVDLDDALTRIVEAAAAGVSALRGTLDLLDPGGANVTRTVRVDRVAGEVAGDVPSLEAPIVLRDVRVGVLRLDGRAADDLTADDLRTVRAFAAAAGIVVLHARLRDAARVGRAWQDAASEVTRLLLAGATTHEVSASIARHVRDLCDATDVAVFLPTQDGPLRWFGGVGPTAGGLVGVEIDRSDGVIGAAFRDGAGRRLDEEAAREALRESIAPPPVGPALIVPLTAAGSTRGVVTATRPPGFPPFGEATLASVRTFAEHAELAHEVAERRRDAAALTLFADRDRIARNLHDLVIQRLFATGMGLERAARSVTVDPDDATRRIQRAVSDLDATIREIRTTVFALQQPADRASSLRAKVVDVADAATATLGFGPSVRFDGPVDTIVPDDVAEHLLAMLREALANVTRHAGATAVGVDVSARDDVVLLRVTDDGVGMPAVGRRSGLANMAARAGLLGGTLTTSDAGPGTVLEWRVPMRGT